MNIAVLQSLRLMGDPAADKVVRECADRRLLGEVMRRLHGRADSDPRVWGDVPGDIVAFLEDTATLPAWADRRRLARVPRFYNENQAVVAGATVLSGVLAVSGMPRQARLMVFPHNDSRHSNGAMESAERKIALLHGIAGAETARSASALSPTVEKIRLLHGFAASVPKPGAALGPTVRKIQLLQPLGLGVDPANPQLRRAVQAIRLRHAIIRDRLIRTGWDIGVEGIPIHQEDMACTALTLSVLVLDAFDRIAIAVTDQQAADFYHAWRVTAAMLGTRADALPETLAEARELLPELVDRSFGVSVEGERLTRAMLSAYEGITPNATTGELAAAARLMLGQPLADFVGLPATPPAAAPAARETAARIGQALLNAVR